MDSSRGTTIASDRVERTYQSRSIGKVVYSAVCTQAHKTRNEAMRQWADGSYSNKGFFDEALVYYDGEGVYFPSKKRTAAWLASLT